ncbi:MAG TPA: DUF503 domain-containing protein [bacterium]
MIVGALRLELHVPEAQSLKDKRSAVTRLKEQMRSRFNVAVAEVDANDKWQRATVAVSTVGDNAARVEATLRQVTDWARMGRGIVLITVEQECW